MNFTADVKKELISRAKTLFKRVEKSDVGKNKTQKKAALSAFVRTSGELGFVDGKPTFFVVSATENVAEFFSGLFFDVFERELAVSHATFDKMSGRDKLVLQAPRDFSEIAVSELRLLRRDKQEFRRGISSVFTKDELSAVSYVIGAFLGGGSCTLPSEGGKTGYHLEVVFPDKKLANDFCNLLAELYVNAKVVERKENFVAYIKSKEVISDFLSAVGAENCLKKFSSLVEKRDESNRLNRSQNCASGNADKTALASVKQVVAIRRIMDCGLGESLTEELKDVARARLVNPSYTMKELADSLGISKSCLNHRLRKLMEISKEIP